jgi:hypothetical protein
MKKYIAIVVALLAIGVLGALFLAPSGGCGIATVQVKTPTGLQPLKVGLDSSGFFGRNIESDDLVHLVETRIKEKAGSPMNEEWRTNFYNRKCYKIDRAIDILIRIEHPKVKSLCKQLLQDPYFCHRAVDYLVKIGGEDSGKAILWAWRSDPKYPYVYINALQKLKDPRAIPLIIDSIGPQYQHVGNRVEVIEEISGETLGGYYDHSAHFQSSTDTLKRNLWIWWIDYKNKNGIQSI